MRDNRPMTGDHIDVRHLLQAVGMLDAWFDTMRCPAGYGGPVVHWWRNCLQFTGPGLDWRYEGIIIGYLNLYASTGEDGWLAKARRAGDDLVQGQLSTSSYRDSCFELNPCSGGTPHEAACDLALLQLAGMLQERDDPSWRTYFATAERNIRAYYLGQLWDAAAQAFRDDPNVPSFVPNKAATLVEALLSLARLTGDASLIQVYAQPTLEAVLAHQVQGGPFDGAIYQNSFGLDKVRKFFPYYIARCVPALVSGYARIGEERYLDAALRAMAFVLRWRSEDGSFPQVIYPGGRVNRYPQWIAPVGDILRAMHLLESYGLDADPQPTLVWLLAGQEPTGAFRTADGFAVQISQREPGPRPEFRDVLPVVGWNDKAFRYLTEILPAKGRQASGVAKDEGTLRATKASSEPSRRDERPRVYEVECSLRGQRVHYREDDHTLELRQEREIVYRWQRGTPWAEVCAPELWWK
jgi:hypothetical protein